MPPPLLTKEAIAETLESIARLLELKGGNPFKIRAYTNAARAVETWPGDLAEAARNDALDEIPGIGKAIAEKIGELVKTGKLEFYEKLRAEFPAGLFELFELRGLGTKKIKTFYEELHIHSLAELERAANDGRIAGLPGFGEKSAANIRASLEAMHRHAGSFRLGDVAADAERILEDLRSHPAVLQASAVGSYRRKNETVHDLDFLVATREPRRVLEDFAGHELVEKTVAQDAAELTARLRSGVNATLYAVTGEAYPFSLALLTGNREHVAELQRRAREKGWEGGGGGDGGSKREDGKGGAQPAGSFHLPASVRIQDEAELYRALGLDFIEPELRENRGEFAAAEKRALPKLVALENLRGTFHNHTNASDGHASLEEMAQAAQELGLEYLGIADHSKSSFQAHGLQARELAAQGKKIAKLNETFGKNFHLFAGVECDIKRDGSLDFPDEVLGQLDYAVASVHASFKLPEAEMTRRIIRAISNPHITMLGHMTGRLLLARDPYAVDVPAVIEAAAETGTIIELNAAPARLDMDWRWWPLAKERGVKCSINPDAHSPAGLQLLWFGITQARKGWLTREDVINCLPLAKVEAVLGAKRKKHHA